MTRAQFTPSTVYPISFLLQPTDTPNGSMTSPRYCPVNEYPVLSTVFSVLVIDMMCSECLLEVSSGVSNSMICLFSAVETIWIAWTRRNYVTMEVCCVLGILGMKGGWVHFGRLGYHVYNVSRGRSRFALNDICMKWGVLCCSYNAVVGGLLLRVFAFAHINILTMSINVFTLTWVSGLKE